MRQLFRKKLAWFILAICFLLFILTTQSDEIDERDYINDENLSVYLGNPDYRIEDGFAIINATNTLENCRSDVQTAKIPEGVEAIASVAFTDCRQLKSVIVPEGVRVIEGSAFAGCETLTSITLPTTLEEIYAYVFFDCDFETLIIPRNTRLIPGFNESEWYGVLDVCRVKTLVFCGTDGLFMPTTFGNIKFPSDGSGRIVFWGNPPEYIQVSDLLWNYEGGEVDSGAFTICFPSQYAEQWAPNGETSWNGLPIRALTAAEEQSLIQEAPKLFADEDRTDVSIYPGWSFDQNRNVTVYSEEGWRDYCASNWGMEINNLRFMEGITDISAYDSPTSDSEIDSELPEITIRRLILPASLKTANLNHMSIQEIVLATDNQHFRTDENRLIEISTGNVVWPHG